MIFTPTKILPLKEGLKINKKLNSLKKEYDLGLKVFYKGSWDRLGDLQKSIDR